MRKFIIRILVFCTIVCSIDLLFGLVIRFVESRSNDQNYHCMYNANEDILILGSSFAQRNIIPSILEDSLGLSCYNAGVAGNGIICAWARYCVFCNKNKPKLILYTLTPGYDYLETDDYSKYLDVIKPLYGKDSRVDDLFITFGDKNDKYLLYSSFIRYNTTYINFLINSYKKQEDFKGYTPLYNEYTPMATIEHTDHIIDSKKLEYVDMFFANITKNNIPLLVLLPPQYKNTINKSEYNIGIELAGKYNIPVIDNLDNTYLSENSIYMSDYCHLNDKGAKLYSALLANEIKKYFSNN